MLHVSFGRTSSRLLVRDFLKNVLHINAGRDELGAFILEFRKELLSGFVDRDDFSQIDYAFTSESIAADFTPIRAEFGDPYSLETAGQDPSVLPCCSGVCDFEHCRVPLRWSKVHAVRQSGRSFQGQRRLVVSSASVERPGHVPLEV